MSICIGGICVITNNKNKKKRIVYNLKEPKRLKIFASRKREPETTYEE